MIYLIKKIIDKCFNSIKGSFWHFLIPYIVILSIPIFLAYVIYFFSSQIVGNEVYRSTYSLMEQARQAIDSRLEEVEDLTIQVSTNSRIRYFMHLYRPLTVDDRYMAAVISSDLKNYRISNRFISDFYIYFKNNNFIINNQSRYDPEFFHNNIYEFKNFSYEQWYTEFLNKYHHKEYLNSTPVLDNNYSHDKIIFLNSLPYDDKSSWLGTLIVLINEENISSLLKNISEDGNSFSYIINSENQVITSSGKAITHSLKYDDLNQNNKYMTETIDNREMVISYTTSHINSWKYVSIVPLDVYMSTVNNLRTLIIKISIILLFIGISIACILAYKDYIHMIAILDTLDQEESDYYSIIDSVSNYSSLKLIVEQAVKESKSFRTQIPTLKAGFLSKLVKGDIRSIEESKNYMELLDIHFNYPTFGIMILYLEEAQNLIDSNPKLALQSIQDIIADIVCNIYFPNLSMFAITLEENKVIVLCNFAIHKEEENFNKITGIATQLIKQIDSEYLISIAIAISNMCSGIENIYICYQQAIFALNYRLIKGRNSIIKYSDILVENNGQDYYYSLEVETYLNNLIKSGEFSAVSEVLDEVYRENFIKRQLSPGIAKCLMYDMMSTAIKGLQNTSIEYEKIFDQKYDPVVRLTQCDTIEELYSSLRYVYTTLCDYTNHNKKSHNTRLKDDILQYINDNYHNKDICLDMIAGEFKMASAYLSRFFKEQTGENFIDYLNKIKLQKAMLLLTGKKRMHMNLIVEEVGYTNTLALTRVFKKYLGITPTQYREQVTSNNHIS